ncbi:MAG: hypothetical protein ABI629_07095 [bacterium]
MRSRRGAVLVATLLLTGCGGGNGAQVSRGSPFRNLGKRADVDLAAALPAPGH